MQNHALRIGRISYLNVWPLFAPLTKAFPESDQLRYISGHPSELNASLAAGGVDMAPASAFAYLENPLPFCLLPELSICAARGPIQSVLLVSPVPLEELPEYLRQSGQTVFLSQASASSNALLKTLWRYAWGFAEPRWETMAPGLGATTDRPFVEIGDLALRHYLTPPQGRHVIDLGQAWKDFTGLPFVFALWIARRGLGEKKRETLRRVAKALAGFKGELGEVIPGLAASSERPAWISPEALRNYFQVVAYDLGPNEQASLLLFAHYCREQGLIKAVPELVWQD
jgi:chorismate dehydratase